jgi:TM2 domain-containing membrane protein YozV
MRDARGAAAALLLSACLAGAQADYFAPAAVAAFADHLFAQGDYLRAGYEYERYLFGQLLEGDSSAAAHERAGRAFRCAGDYPRALDHFRRMQEAAAGDEERQRAAAEIGLSLLHEGDAAGSLALLQAEPGWQDSSRLRLLCGGDLILLGRWEEAQAAVGGLPGREAGELVSLARRGASLRRRSPALAAVLSAVIPGAGKMYAGETGDGLQSLLLIGALAALSAASFHADGVASWRGWLYASFGGAMYAGNLYGSAISARRWNQKQEEALREDLQALLPACAPGSASGSAPGGSGDAR